MISETLKHYIMSRIIPVNGLIYVNGNTTAQSIPNGTTYTKLTFPGMTTGFKKHITIDPITRDVTIQKKGRYFFTFNFSSLSSANNIILETTLLKNDVVEPSMYMKRQFSGLAVISHATLTGAVDCEKGDVLRVAVRHDYASAVNLTVQYGNIFTHKI